MRNKSKSDIVKALIPFPDNSLPAYVQPVDKLMCTRSIIVIIVIVSLEQSKESR